MLISDNEKFTWRACAAFVLLGVVLFSIGVWPREALLLLLDLSLWFIRGWLCMLGIIAFAIGFTGLIIKARRG